MKLLILFILLSFNAFADDGIEVQGKCEIKVVPDLGSLHFTVENLAKDQKQAVKLTTEQVNKLKADLESLKLAKYEIKTTHYNVVQVREYENNKYVTKGMKASMGLEIETSDIPRLGEAMALASKNNITNIGSLVTSLSLDKSQKEYLKCLEIASQDASVKAHALAKKLNFKVGKVLKLIESPNTVERPRPFPMLKSSMAMNDSASADMGVEAGTHTFSTNILVTFEIK